MKTDFALPFLGSVLVSLLMIGGVAYQVRQDMPQPAAASAEAFVPSGRLAWLANAPQGTEEYRLARAVETVGRQERAVVTRNLSPGQSIDDTPCRTALIAQDSRYTVQERIEALADLQRRLNYETAIRQPIVQDVMIAPAVYR